MRPAGGYGQDQPDYRQALANLSGEATIEVQSTVQQLRTAYADRAAQHADAGGEIGRDEIPAALESYVEQYFEQVRKQPAPAKK